MRKIQIVGLALVAVLAFSVVAASYASAAEWLVKGLAVVGEPEVETKGALKLIHLAGGFLEPEAVVECTGVFVGKINATTDGSVTAVLNGSNEAITALTKPLVCKGVTTCENPSPEDALVVPLHLPWLTTLSLMEVGGKNIYLVLFSSGGTGLPGYEINCLALGMEHEVVCEGETSAVVELKGTALEGTFSKTELESEGLEGNCGAQTKVALQEGKGTISLVGKATEEIDVSE